VINTNLLHRFRDKAFERSKIAILPTPWLPSTFAGCMHPYI